ncbi:peptidoglycan/LPS O-acetylase OafA/YrhL [Bradyrhizobium sp. AZCC 1610]|uniref:acyltransferase family protein n=1 Tax=Bradyrhizobium sp. AZCC 1610 TaxID=3117020 RepID=UPI002FF1B5E6
MSSSEQTNYYPLFDYIRAIAAIGIFFAHSGTLISADAGNFCVQVFFALSGYLIGGILLRSKPDDLPRFYFNRSFRIWIPYAVAIGILFAATAAKQGLQDTKIFEFFVYMVTFVYNWFGPPQLATAREHMPLHGTGNHFWSICVEEQFYLLAPLLIMLVRRWVVMAILAGLVVLNFVLPHDFASIALGVLLAIFGRERSVAIAAASSALVIAVAFPYPVWAPFLAVSIIAACSMQGSQTRLGRIVGGASFPFYLNHWIGLFAINPLVRYGLPHWSAVAIAFLISSSFSLIHFALIDSWIAKNRERFFTQRRGAMLLVAGLAMIATGLATAINVW